MKFNFKQTLSILVLAGITMFSTSSSASFSNEQLLKVLLGNGAITQQQHDELLDMSADDEQKTEEMSANDVQVTLDKGSLKLQSKDESFKMQVGGRIMVDAASFDDGSDQYDDGTKLRRARLFVSGTVWRDWHYKGQYDFASAETSIKDAWIKYTGLNDILEMPLDITFGNFKEPFGMEELTSSKYITFMERSMASNTFAPSRNVGLGFNTYGKVMNEGGWSATVGYFGHGIDDDDDGDESYGYVGRATFAPIATTTRVLHVGGSVEHRKWKGLVSSHRSYRLRARPENHIGSTRIVDTDEFKVDDLTTWGFDTAAVYGPFSVQGEYFHQNVNSVAFGDLDFDGWYAYMSYFLTGESRVYDAKKGLFKRTKPNSIVGKGGYGAWELAARYSAINLNDGAINGGRAENITLGVNWYATPTIRFMGNYVLTDASRSDKENPNIFQLRGQVDF